MKMPRAFPAFEPKVTALSLVRGLIVAALLIWVTSGMLANLQDTHRPWFEYAWRLTMASAGIVISIGSMFNVAKIPWRTGLVIFAIDALLLLSANGSGVSLRMRTAALAASRPDNLIAISEFDVPLTQRASLRAVASRAWQTLRVMYFSIDLPASEDACRSRMATLADFPDPPPAAPQLTDIFATTMGVCARYGVDPHAERLRAIIDGGAQRADAYRAGRDPDLDVRVSSSPGRAASRPGKDSPRSNGQNEHLRPPAPRGTIPRRIE